MRMRLYAPAAGVRVCVGAWLNVVLSVSVGVGASVSARGGALASAENPLTDEGSQGVVHGESLEAHCVNDFAAGSHTETLLRLPFL